MAIRLEKYLRKTKRLSLIRLVDKSELTELFRARDVFSEGQEYVEENYNDWSKL